ncbi:hypothetical protein [Pseudocitrobacter cyperus]|uniref:Uncharacterized protein n=1 Tax=Pseudocitrobacter cyperus TaxID=3112843 RepID=A0ABV0HFP3_9ENTR
MLKFIINAFIFFLLLFTVYIVICFYSDVRNSKELLAVQWCRVDYNKYSRYRGIYIYMVNNGNGEVIIRGQLYERRMLSIWRPYRLYFTDVIATEVNAQIAINKWSKIMCGKEGVAFIGDNKYVIN